MRGRPGLAHTGDGALRPSRKRVAATSSRARCCLSASSGALRTKRSQTTPMFRTSSLRCCIALAALAKTLWMTCFGFWTKRGSSIPAFPPCGRNSMPIPSSNRLWVTSPTAEKFAFEFEIFRLTLVPLGEGTLTVTKQPQRLKLRVREMSCFRDSTLIISTALTK